MYAAAMQNSGARMLWKLRKNFVQRGNQCIVQRIAFAGAIQANHSDVVLHFKVKIGVHGCRYS
jgi:hypothetical protein